MEQVQAWMTTNSIPITGSIELSVDGMGYVKELTTDATFTSPQIASFKRDFFNKRSQGNKGDDIASAGTITLTLGNLFHITGTTTINFITTTTWKTGTMVCFKFDSAITINHNTGSVPSNTFAIFLKGSTNISFNAGSTLTLICDGDYWREIARMES